MSDTYTVYLAGPMSNIREFNFPLFFDATDWLRQVQGWEVLSPAEKDLERIPWEEMQTIPGFDTGDLPTYMANCPFTMETAMEWDLPAIQQSNGIVLLPDWETSTGARWERTVAEALGRDIWLMYPCGEPGMSFDFSYMLVLDPQPKRLTTHLKRFAEPLVFSEQAETQGEFRVVDAKTGGEKGAKPQAMHLLPYDVLIDESEHYHQGAQKYAERNWEKGYAWSLSFAALQRHLLAWWQGEDDDPEFGQSHLRGVIFHALALRAFELRGAGTDDRPGRKTN